jgi:hypothetical protein
MTRIPHDTLTLLALLLTSMLLLVFPATGLAGEAPVKEIIESHIGWEADKTTKAPICTVASKHECQPALVSSQPGGFDGAISVAGGDAPTGNVYVLDGHNRRVQELSAEGKFIAMFGWDVNKTKENESAPQAERNICTQESGDTCQAGVEGTAPGQFSEPVSIAVDPTNDDFYVAEIVLYGKSGGYTFGERVQKFSAGGQFILEIGKDVNETTGGNLCSREEEIAGTKCKGPLGEETNLGGDTEPGAFGFYQFSGNMLTVGGPEDLLYVGDGHAVQEFRPNGTSAGEPATQSAAITTRLEEISSSPRSYVLNIAVDNNGDTYLGYLPESGGENDIIREFDKSGKEVKEFTVPGVLTALAIDPAGRLGVLFGGNRGLLYEVGATKLHRLTEFDAEEIDGISFNGNGDLYALTTIKNNEVVAYHPVPVAELGTSTTRCVEGPEHETSVTLDCAVNGTVNPEGVSETELWLEWGKTPIVEEGTSMQPVVTGTAPVSVEPEITGAYPHEKLYYQLAATDKNVPAPELLTSEQESLQTPAIPPRIVGQPGVSFVRSESAVMSGVLNPENTATRYEFQYGPCEDGEEQRCATSPYTNETLTGESSTYAKTKAVLEAVALQPGTMYHYRLSAVNEADQAAVNQAGGSVLPEGVFRTAPAPVPRAVTGAASMIGATSALVAGMAGPEGQPATYAFELGVYAGAGTQYGTAFRGSVSASGTLVEESLGLSGLQPGTTYAYRIAVSSGYGQATGATQTFTTEGLPSVLSVPGALAMLSVPNVAFPAEPATVERVAKHKTKKRKREQKRIVGKRGAKKGSGHKGESHKRKK